MLNNLKLVFLAGIIGFVGGYFVKAQGAPTEIDSSVKSTYDSQISELKSQLAESETNLEKSKSEQKNKTKVLVKNADGSSTLTESESSTILENEFLQAKSKLTEQDQLIEHLKSQISSQQSVKNECSGVFLGPGITNDYKPEGIIGGHFGAHGVALTGDGIDRKSIFYIYHF